MRIKEQLANIFTNKHADTPPAVTSEINQPTPLEATKTPDEARREKIRIAQLTSELVVNN